MRRTTAAILAMETGIGTELVSLALSRITIGLGSDFAVYYAAARALRLNPSANIYQWSTIHANMSPIGACGSVHSPFVYPPLLAILLEPLSLLPCASAYHVWEALNAILLAGALYILSQVWPQTLRTFALLCVATLMSFPMLMGLWYGQIHILVMFGLIVVLWRYRRGNHIGAGIVLALICLIQMTPGLFVVYFILRRERRIVVSTLATAGVATLGMVIVVGIPGLLNFLHSKSGTYALNEDFHNASLVYRFGLWFAFIDACLYFAVLIRHRGDPTVGYLWTILSLLLLSPIVWAYFFCWLTPVSLRWWLRNNVWLRVFIVAAYIALYFSKDFVVIQAVILVAAWLALGWEYFQPTSAPVAIASPPRTEVVPLARR